MHPKRKLTDADHVWNRACRREGTTLREGDRALGALLLVHGYIMNGGVCHAFDLTTKELADGIKGYQYFRLDELVAIIKPHDGEKEADYNRRYYDFFRDRNDPIRERFREVLRERPERFAPLK